jgi:serine/threonine protein kinase/tetratricopeptide (TPR) repeat protein
MTGQRVLHYEVLEKLGEGGMSVVYKALDHKLNRFVALKFLQRGDAGSPEFRQKLQREANAISALNHPNIATIHDVHFLSDQSFLVLEYLAGGTLRTHMSKARNSGRLLSISEVLEYAKQAAEGLAYAHRKGIIHGDIKPGNLMLTEDGRLKITDFGLSRLEDEAQPQAGGVVEGTVSYMAPEQVLGEPSDARSDVYSFGLVLFELSTNRLPFVAATEAGLLKQIVNDTAPPLRKFRPDAPAALEQIIAKALARRREDRYQSMPDLLEDLTQLRRFLEDITGVATETMHLQLGNPPLQHRRKWIIGGAAVLTTAAVPMLLPGVRNRISTWGWFSDAGVKQIAVLPFRSISASDTGVEALSAGLVEILTNKLTQLEQFQDSLRVIDASEVRKSGATSPQEAWKTLGAPLAITGSVQRSGTNNVVIPVNLVDTRKTVVLAARMLDEPYSEGTQEELIQKVADMLELHLAPEARRTLSAGLSTVPGAYELYTQGRGYLQRFDKSENLDRAIAVFEKALALDPKYALASSGLAEAWWRKFEVSNNREFLEKARSICLRALDLNPQLAPVHLTMGVISRSYGRYDDAIQSFETCLRLDRLNADGYRELANAYDAAKRPADAEATFQRAIRLRKDYWAGYKDLGVFYFRHGRYKEAQSNFERVVQLTPDNYSGWANLGAAKLELGRPEEAIQMFERSLALNPSAKAYSNLGSIYYFQKRYREAAEKYKLAAESSPMDFTLWGNLADAYRWIPDPQNAQAAYRRATELVQSQLLINPKNARWRASLATYLSGAGNHEKAVQEIDRALEDDPANGFVLYRAGVIYEQAGMRQRALGALASAIKAGYSIEEIGSVPTLESLRKDSRYPGIIKSGKSK